MNIATTRNEARWRGTPCHCPNTEVPLSLQSPTNPESIFVTHIGGTASDNCDNPLIESIGTHSFLPRPPAYRLTPLPCPLKRLPGNPVSQGADCGQRRLKTRPGLSWGRDPSSCQYRLHHPPSWSRAPSRPPSPPGSGHFGGDVLKQKYTVTICMMEKGGFWTPPSQIRLQLSVLVMLVQTTWERGPSSHVRPPLLSPLTDSC